jgi:DNA-directed RNA polymerase specialized sigma24 family protein
MSLDRVGFGRRFLARRRSVSVGDERSDLPIASEDLRLEVLALQPALRIVACGLTADDNEADDLVQLTVAEALKGHPSGEADPGDTRLWLFALLRKTFYSVARRRQLPGKRMRTPIRHLELDGAVSPGSIAKDEGHEP